MNRIWMGERGLKNEVPVVAFFALIAAATAVRAEIEEEEGPPAPVDIMDAMHKEVPEGTYDPLRSLRRVGKPGFGEQEREKQSPSRMIFQRGGIPSTQVNVDADGLNIVGDAANEPSMAIDPRNPNRIVIGWRQFDTITDSFRQAGVAYSHDGGQTWHSPGVLEPGEFSSDPVLEADSFGNFYYYALQPERGPGAWACYLYKSFDGGVTWPQEVYAFGGDKAWIAVDRSGGPGDGHIYAIWTSNNRANCCGLNRFTRSTDGGVTWDLPIPVPGDVFAGTITVAPSGTVWAVGVPLFPSTLVPVVRSNNAQFAEVTARVDLINRVDIGGTATLGDSRSPNPVGLLGQMNVAVGPAPHPADEPVYVLGSVDPGGSDPMDVHFVRGTNRGLDWTEPRRINTDPPATHAYQWFGAISVAPGGRIDVVWYDTRASASTTQSELYYAFSPDQGETWSINVPISMPFNHSLGYPVQRKLGDYIQVISRDNFVHIAYAATFNGEQDVYYTRIRPITERCLLAGVIGGGDDCNDNGISDECDVLEFRSPDRNGNLVPDECESDFDGDGLLDDGDPDIDDDGVVNGQDVCDFTPLGQPVLASGQTIGDANLDCAVTAADYRLMEPCISQGGPDEAPFFRFCSEQFDYDGDEDVDLRDAAAFFGVFGSVSASPGT